MPTTETKYINREVSWLHFNDRVLQEAADPRVPLLERLAFLGIFSSNMDEFFRVRVASIRRLAEGNRAPKVMLGGNPKKILAAINEMVQGQRHRFDKIYADVLYELKLEGVHMIDESLVSPEQGEFIKAHFARVVRPTLVPIMLDSLTQPPMLRDKSLYMAVLLANSPGSRNRYRHALLELPTSTVGRFVVLPPDGEKQYLMLLDDVVRYNLKEIFSIFTFEKAQAFTLKFTRDAEYDIDDDVSESLLMKVSKGVKQRKRGKLVRFIYDESMPEHFLRYLTRKLDLRKTDNLVAGARYHNFKDFIRFPRIGPPHLSNPQYPTLINIRVPEVGSLFAAIKKHDILLHYPYQGFDTVIDLLREAAIDPQVTSIKITLYRVAEYSNIINALVNAVRNGKSVTVVLELQARFDEEANIFWANRLREEGARVLFGISGMKVHSKLCIIARKEGRVTTHYCHIGTGNFNERTASLYADHTLLTAHPGIATEVEGVFQFLETHYKTGVYKHLLVSPFGMRLALGNLISAEIKAAKLGKICGIVLKMNSLVDEEMITSLYRASAAGVPIKLIVRGICSLRPGVPGLSENIEAISIVDSYLEHARVFVFANMGEPKVFLSSADMMTRNLDHRVEVACSIYDPVLKTELLDMLEFQWADNTKSRWLDGSGTNPYKESTTQLGQARAQLDFYHYLRGELDPPKSSLFTSLASPQSIVAEA